MVSEVALAKYSILGLEQVCGKGELLELSAYGGADGILDENDEK